MEFLYFFKENKLISLVISVLLNVILLVCSFVFSYKYFNYECKYASEELNISSNELASENNVEEYFVEVKGAVKKPSVYKVNDNFIINDVINLAGGFNKNAYTKNINLSRKVSKELVVYVYTENEYKKINSKKDSEIVKYVYEKTPCECSTYDISSCTDNVQSEIVASNKDTKFDNNTIKDSVQNEASSKVNINTATKDILLTLTGIGDTKADDIINYRETNGLFKKIEEIKNVSGIGEALFNKIKDSITV